MKNYNFATERSAYLNSLGIPLNHETTIEGQTIFLAERVSELMQPNIVTDRTIIDVMAFCSLSKSMKKWEKDYLNATLYYLIDDYDILFYVSPKGVEIEDNDSYYDCTNYCYRKFAFGFLCFSFFQFLIDIFSRFI